SDGDGDEGGDALAETPSAERCGAPADATVPHAAVARGHCAWVFAEDLSTPRGLTSVKTSEGRTEALVVERRESRVTALWDDDGDRVAGEDERAVIAGANGLNHGVLVHDGWLYASSDTTVFRWKYTPGEHDSLGEPTVVVRGLPPGGHSTRTLAADDEWLYVQVGSGGNVDDDSSRSRIVRYRLEELDAGARTWKQGKLFADGLRNEVGLDWGPKDRLWGVENGRDNLKRDDLGGDIHADNPSEELNLFAEPGKFYGYPYCWSEFRLPDDIGRGPGTEWADPKFMDDGTHTDEWCRDESNVVPPELAMQAHSAPLDLLFWEGGDLGGDYEGDAFVSFHGSWNRPTPTGYKVVRIPFDGTEPQGVGPFLEHAGPEATEEDAWPHRPVGLAAGPNGELLVSSDRSDVVLAVAKTR
ncbi:MAG: PQQ-dependent sugar dehydrogenase, partial [Gemmatimonadota bacterium]